MKKNSAFTIGVAFGAVVVLLCSRSHGEAVYSTPGTEHLEAFDLLPTDLTGNSSIEGLYPDGWMDDSITEEGHVGLAGWYLYHPLSPAVENGFNGHQRLRFGPGANTGSFWALGEHATNPEKALGSIGSLTMAENGVNMYFALRLVNGTGVTLTEFTVTFDGEQWRDGRAETGETLFFDYSLTATVEDWFAEAVFTRVPTLDYTAPVISGVGTSGTPVNGNVEGLVPGLTATVSGVSWAPGASLWLRWTDPQLGGPDGASYADDAMAIDNLKLSAVVGVVLPAADLTVETGGTGQKQLVWRGTAGISAQVQHSLDLSEWLPEGAPVMETDGPVTFPIPPALQTTDRHFFRLKRTLPDP